MAIESNFTFTVQYGPVSPPVQFNDITTGGADSWLWDFGDGNFSDEQHPLHDYSGSYGSSFTVTLTAWRSGGSTINVLSQADNNKKYSKSPIPWQETNDQAHDDLLTALATGWDNPSSIGGPAYSVFHRSSDDKYNYDIGKQYFAIVSAAAPSHTTLEVYFSIASGLLEGSFLTSEWGSKAASNNNTWQTYASIDAGTDFGDVMFEPTGGIVPSILSAPPSESSVGFGTSFRLVTWDIYLGDPDNTGSSSQVVNITGSVDFVGTPRVGFSPLVVQFTDLSVLNHSMSTWDFGDGNSVTVAGFTHPINTYVSVDQ